MWVTPFMVWRPGRRKRKENFQIQCKGSLYLPVPKPVGWSSQLQCWCPTLWMLSPVGFPWHPGCNTDREAYQDRVVEVLVRDGGVHLKEPSQVPYTAHCLQCLTVFLRPFNNQVNENTIKVSVPLPLLHLPPSFCISFKTWKKMKISAHKAVLGVNQKHLKINTLFAWQKY